MAVGTITLTSRELVDIGKSERNYIEVVTVDWAASSTDASIPTLAVDLRGWLVKAITNPGTTAPTANYDISLTDPEDSGLDAAATLLNNRHTSTTEQVYPLISGAASPILLAGTYTISIANNSVNSATGRIIFYLAEDF